MDGRRELKMLCFEDEEVTGHKELMERVLAFYCTPGFEPFQNTSISHRDGRELLRALQGLPATHPPAETFPCWVKFHPAVLAYSLVFVEGSPHFLTFFNT